MNVYSPKRAAKWFKPDRRGELDTGHVVKLLIGKGHGFIRLADDREIYFHRADLQEGTSFNDLGIGDPVIFERLDDSVSGTRALAVRRKRRGSNGLTGSPDD